MIRAVDSCLRLGVQAKIISIIGCVRCNAIIQDGELDSRQAISSHPHRSRFYRTIPSQMCKAAFLRFFLLTVASFAIPGGEGTSEPDLPQITGAFDVELDVRFNSMDVGGSGPYQNIFQYVQPNGGNSIELLQNYNTIWLQIGSFTNRCHAPGVSVVLDHVYHYRFGVTHYNLAYILRDGVVEVTCPGLSLPPNVQRDTYLGNGPSTNALRGAVLGVQVLHWQQHNPISTRLKNLNLAGQSFQDGLEATFHARFDSLGDRSGQRVFEFGTGAGADSIWCGQLSNTTTMECGMVGNGVPYQVTAVNAIEEGVFANWKFRVDNGGSFQLEKNGAAVAQATHSISRSKVFRQLLYFGESTAVSDDLDGVVVGFRLQRLSA